MGLINDLVTAGDYKNADIKVKGMKNDKVLLIHQTLLGKKEIRLDKNSVESIEEKAATNLFGTSQHQVEICFKNGKKCLATLSELTYRALNTAMY